MNMDKLPGLETKQESPLVDWTTLETFQDTLPYIPGEQDMLPTEEE